MDKLIEAFKMKCLQLQHAIRHGDDHLVSILDREIEPLIQRIVNARAENSHDIRSQLLLICDVIRDGAGDKAAVLRNTAVLMALLNRYFRPVNGLSIADLLPEIAALADERRDASDEPTLAEALIESMPDPVIAVTRDHRVLYANHRAADRAGKSVLDLIGNPVSVVVGTPFYRESLAPAINSCLEDPTVILRLPKGCTETIVHAVKRIVLAGDHAPDLVLVTQRPLAA